MSFPCAFCVDIFFAYGFEALRLCSEEHSSSTNALGERGLARNLLASLGNGAFPV